MIPAVSSPAGHRPTSAGTRPRHAAPHDSTVGYTAGSSGTTNDNDRDADVAATNRRPPDPKNRSNDAGNAHFSSSLATSLGSRLQGSVWLKRTRTEHDTGDNPKSKKPCIDEAARAAGGGKDDDDGKCAYVNIDDELGTDVDNQPPRTNESGDDGDDDEDDHMGTDVDNQPPRTNESGDDGAPIGDDGAPIGDDDKDDYVDDDMGYLGKYQDGLSVQLRPSERIEELRSLGFMVFEDLDPKTVQEKIEGLLLSAALTSYAGKGCSFEVPTQSKVSIFHDGIGYVHKIGKTVKYDLTEDNMLKISGLICVLSVIAEALEEGITITNRHVFYCAPDIFGTQAVSDNLIFKVCCMLGCLKSSLNVISESKGSVAGPLSLELKNGKVLSCSELNGQRIPTNLSEIEHYITTRAKCILIVEKKSVYHHLVQMGFPEKMKCILITGGGFPDIATRLFVKRLHIATELPIYAFLDADAYGVEILSVYTFGSTNMSFDRMGMAVPSVRWIGLFPTDLDDLGISGLNFSAVTPREKQRLEQIMLNPKFPVYWSHKLKSMLDVKAPLESLYSLGLSFMSNEFLPKLLSRAHSSLKRR